MSARKSHADPAPVLTPELRTKGAEAARDLCAFVDASPTPYHAVLEASRRLRGAGFRQLAEKEVWEVTPGERCFVIRGGGTIVAFVVGTDAPDDAGFRIIGAHTDSPNLRVKPHAEVTRSGYRQVGVEVYGGVILATWMDRDLSLAGRVLCDRGRPGAFEARLVDFKRPIARIPNLAIHLNRSVNTEGLLLNQQKHLPPVLGLGGEGWLRNLLAHELGEKPESILSYDLCFYDTLPSAIGGLDGEFVFAPRLDNLGSTHGALSALIAQSASSAPETRVIALYDHEECGSKTASGAAGPVLRDTLERILEAGRRSPQAFPRAMAASLLVSADMAHAIHPNYADQHDAAHAPELNRGLVIKSNSNQSYATDGPSAAFIEQIGREVGYTPQRFVVRSDLPCGSTIGPITAAALGIPTVDVGSPMLSMHSCREMAGALDVYLALETYRHALGGR